MLFRSTHNGIEAGYRILKTQESIGAFNPLNIEEDGSFSVSLTSSMFEEGISIVEIYSKTQNSEESYGAVPVAKVSPLPEINAEEPKAKAPVAANPVFTWIEAGQVYYTCYYQGDLSLLSVSINGTLLDNGISYNQNQKVELFSQAGILPYSLFSAGTKVVEVKVEDAKAKTYSSKHNIITQGYAEIKIDSVKNIPYVSGMEIILPGPGVKTAAEYVKVIVTSTVPITSVTGTIGNENLLKATVKKVISDSDIEIEVPGKGMQKANEYEALFVIPSLSAQLQNIEVFAEVSKDKTISAKGTIAVVREEPINGVQD